MVSTVLPDFPELGISYQDWLRDTELPLNQPRKSVRTVDRNFHSCESAAQGYSVARDNIQSLEGYRLLRAGPNEQRLFDVAVRSFHEAAAAWDGLRASFEEWSRSDSGERRNARNAVTRLQAGLDAGVPVIARGRDLIKEATEEIDVANVFHLGWVGGEPTDEVMRKAIILSRVHPDASVNIWIDKENLLAGDWKRQTEALRSDRQFTVDNDPAIDARLDIWKDDRNFTAGLDAKLVSDPVFAERLASHRERLEHLQRALPGESFPGIRIRDVAELWQEGREFPANPAALTWQDRMNVKQGYRLEVGMRLCFAAATDRARDLIVHDEPGQWLDIDKRPPIKEFGKLIDAYNTALDRQLRSRMAAANITPSARRVSVPPDPELMQADYKKLKPADLPRPIRASQGHELLDLEGYRLLVDATREHIDPYVPRPDGTFPERQHDRLDALAAHLGSFDPDGHALQAFQNWAANVNSLDQGYGRFPPLKVARLAFKMLEIYPGQGAHINSVLATSTAGARAVSLMVRDKTETVNRVLEEEGGLRSYMDDSPANRDYFITTTILSTGPGQVTNNEKLLVELRDKCGIVGKGSPLMTIPYRHFENPSTSEIHTSWAPQRRAGSPAIRRAHDEPEASRQSGRHFDMYM
jgi:hypothetical protein